MPDREARKLGELLLLVALPGCVALLVLSAHNARDGYFVAGMSLLCFFPLSCGIGMVLRGSRKTQNRPRVSRWAAAPLDVLLVRIGLAILLAALLLAATGSGRLIKGAGH